MENLLRQVPNVISREIAGEVFLVPVRGKLADLQRLFVLNRVGECIWRQLDGNHSRGEILAAIIERFDVDEPQAATDMEEFLAQLVQAGLTEEVA
jgi:hypothetical protein